MHYVALVCYRDCEQLMPLDPSILGVFHSCGEAKQCIETFFIDNPDHGFCDAYVIYPNTEQFYEWDCVWSDPTLEIEYEKE